MQSQDSVAMGIGFFHGDEARFLDHFGQREPHAEMDTGRLEEVSLGLISSDSSERIVVGYVLGEEVENVASAVAATTGLSSIEAGLLNKIVPAEILFHWEDDQLRAANRDAAVPVYAAITLDEDTAAKLQALIEEMLRSHKDGLIERARAVGYYRECMALVRDRQGRPVYALYLEIRPQDYTTLVERLMKYPNTAFNSWWTPQYIELIGRKLVASATSQSIYRWSMAPAP